MAMPPALAAAVVPDKIPLQWYIPQQQQLNEKDGFLMWLRGEFAAANAIIDALCHHLRAVGEPGEYDNAVGCIQQRRCTWSPVLQMQQYFSVAEVVSALQLVGWRRQQLRRGGSKRGARGGGQKGHVSGQANDGGQTGPSAGEKSEVGGQKASFGAEVNGNAKSGPCGTENDKEKESEVYSSPTLSESSHATVVQAEDKNEIEGSIFPDSALQVKKNREIRPRTFIATEIFDGKSVNVAEGMKLYEDLFTDSEVSKLISLVNDLRTSGISGQLQGQTYVVAKRPMRGHGREIIQFGVPLTDSPHEDESASLSSKDQKTEAIPDLLLNTIELLLAKQVLTTKPDTCFIDIFNEGDHSHPHMWPHWYERPICMLFLTDCDMSFGKVITVDRPGDYRGAFELGVWAGTVLVMQGRSTDFARHAVHSLKMQRILVTFLKSTPRKTTPPPPPSSWAPPHHPPTVRPVNLIRPNHRPQILQPIFVSAPGISYPPPPTRLPKPVLPALGTGVFIPPSQTENDIDADVVGDGSGEPNATSHENCYGNHHATIGKDGEKS